MRVLIVEDNPRLADAIARQLRHAGFLTDFAATAESADELIAVHDFDAMILDIMLDKDDGRAFCARLREVGNMIPVLILTALDMTDVECFQHTS